ncbi:MAG TPA: NUDIX domain-containing protein [Stellaceae bacterium]|nr:NUDIX domain-containing protein [Stellaceae bacterium]
MEVLDRETVYQGFFRIDRYRLRHRLFAGGWSAELSREVFERGRAVGVLLYDPQSDAVVLIEQFRLAAQLAGFSAWQLEIVAGIIDHDGESEADVARREASEEAGLAVAGDLVPIQRLLTSPGGTTETVALYCGRVDSQDAGGIHGLAEEHEDIKVVVKRFREVRRLLRDGKIENAFLLIALHWLADNRSMLRRRWSVVPAARPA